MLVWNFQFLLFFAHVTSVLGKKVIVYCDDKYGRYTANGGNLALSSYEFPIMTTIPSGVSGTAVSKLLHPCYSLNTNNNYKNQLYDIFSHGNFVADICERRCAHFVDANRFTCGDRRPSPTWQAGTTNSVNRKINCSNWNIPLTAKGKRDGISLTYTYQTYSTGTGEDLFPPFVMDNKSIEYLDTIPVKWLHIKPIVEQSKKSNAMLDIEFMLDLFSQRHSEISHFAFGNPVVFFGDSIRNQPKYFAPRFTLSDKFYALLATFPNLKSLALSLIALHGNETVPAEMTRNLKSVGFYNVTMSSIPHWVNTENLQFLEFQGTISDETETSVLDNLLNLEHFLLSDSRITSIKSPFLTHSDQLLSLTLQCNAISSISEGAFDHLKKLRYLNLAGNQLLQLPESLFRNMNYLTTLDLKSLDISNSSTLQTFDEVSIQCGLPNQEFKSESFQKMPPIPNPENLLALDIRGQYKSLEENSSLLSNFRNLEILNIGNMRLSSVQNISLEKLLSLEDLNIADNPLDDDQWLGEDVFVKLKLQHLRLGKPKIMNKVPTAYIAFMRTASQIMYSAPISLNQVLNFKNNVDCEYDIVSSATVFGYNFKNQSCAAAAHSSIEKIRAMEMTKMNEQQ